MLREFLSYLSLELNRSPLTVKAYETDLRGFNDFLKKSGVPTDDAGFFVVSTVTTADVREWMASLSEQGVSATSLRRKVQSLRAFFRFLMKSGSLQSNPAAAVPLPKTGRKLPVIATHEDVTASVEAASDPREALVLELLYGCGLRSAELLALTDPDVNFYSKELKVMGKGAKHRIIPLPDSLLAKIKDWQQQRDALYPSLESPRPLIATKRGRMSAGTLYLMVRRALRDSRAGQKSPHTLRHSFATQLLNSGADINSVKELLGHSSLGATQIYTHLAFSELRKEWDKAHPRSEDKTKNNGEIKH